MNRTRESYNILITDDDTGCREALREIVEPQGFLECRGQTAAFVVGSMS